MDWLSFSLSNPHQHQHQHQQQHQHQHSSFETYNNNTQYSSDHGYGTCAAGNGGTCDGSATNTATTTTSSCSDLSMLSFGGGPKLEDFQLGVCSGGATDNTVQQAQLCSFASCDGTTYQSADQTPFTGIYDPDHQLKAVTSSDHHDQQHAAAVFALTSTNGAAGGYSINASDLSPPQSAAVVSPVVSSPVSKKHAVDTFGQRTSIYRGVTRHRWTGRYEAHLWDNSCRREGQSRKGRQVYLGGYDKEDKAARAYDLAALKYWGPTTTTNFPVSNYEREIEEMTNMTRQEFVASLRRKSSGFSRGASIYRGVTRHHQHGRWQARIGRVAGNKDLYLGTFSTQEEAAEAYDIAAIKFRGLNAVTNFDMSRYDVKSIANSNLPIGGIAGSGKSSTTKPNSTEITLVPADDQYQQTSSTNLSFAVVDIQNMKQDPSADYWSAAAGTPFGGSDHQDNNSNLSMDLCSSRCDEDLNSRGFFNGVVVGGGGYVEHLQQYCSSGSTSSSASSSMIPFATLPISTSSYSTAAGSWISPSLHGFQTGSPNLSVFQKPIFGME